MSLLKMARAHDDGEFVLRIAAAMQVKAQEQAAWQLSPESRALTDWVLTNPMIPQTIMVSYVSTNPAIVANISLEDGAISAANVPDGDIQFVVNDKWDQVALYLYPQA